jgi:hypothetical protein
MNDNLMLVLDENHAELEKITRELIVQAVLPEGKGGGGESRTRKRRGINYNYRRSLKNRK